jgi:hypothetical protein
VRLSDQPPTDAEGIFRWHRLHVQERVRIRNGFKPDLEKDRPKLESDFEKVPVYRARLSEGLARRSDNRGPTRRAKVTVL